MKNALPLLVIGVFLLTHPSASAQLQTAPSQPWTPEEITEEERAYFSGVYRDTWNYLADHVEDMTGLPLDSSQRQPVTSMTNIGLYLGATAMAYKTNLIGPEEAVRRIERVLDALEKTEKWRGFPRPWILVRTLKPSFGDEFTYDAHMSVLIGGLTLAKNTFPQLSERITQLMTPMKFRDLYDPYSGWLKGGYNAKHDNFAVLQPWGHWYYKYYASGVRLLSFYGIGKKQIPPDHWQKLIRPIKQEDGSRFFATGYEEPGLEVQFLTTLFLDERFTEMGESQRNYAKYQIQHAEAIKAPVWGWASCQTIRGRYLTYGELRDEIVAPYASILAAIYFPHEAYKNLKTLEEMGARPVVDGQPLQYGFRDSLNWQTREPVDTHLTPNQGMAFLSLANLLHSGVVWETFMQDPTVEQGVEILQLNIPTLPKIKKADLDVEQDPAEPELDAWIDQQYEKQKESQTVSEEILV